MSFGYSILGFGAYPTRGEPDVSNVLIEDENGNDNRFTKVENSSGSNATTHNNDFTNPIELVGGVSGGYTMTLKLNSSFTGNAASFAWTITEVDDPLNNVSISTASSSSADFDAVFTIAAGAAQGQPPANYTFALAVTGTNGNTITTTYTNVLMLVP
tara:strand:- start:104 stop:574 length:471 start_codon:yes stop_codon:yes gene_type:complete